MANNSQGGGEYAFFEGCCHLAHRRLPLKGKKGGFVWENGELSKAIDMLELNVRPEEVHALSLLAALLSLLAAALITIASMLAGFSVTFLFIFFLIFPVIIFFYIEKYPVMLLESKRTEMIGHIPAIASYLVISLRINPVLEKAVEFAAEHTTGFPRKLLKRMVFDIEMGKSSSIVESLYKFADVWGNVQEFRAFMQLLIASTLESSEEGRWMMLDSGMNVLLSGLKERTESTARSMETPILVVFTFLVILPLVFIGLVPIIPTIGINISPLIILFLYDIVLPVMLFIAISLVMSSRPVTIPPVEIPDLEYSRIFTIEVKDGFARYGFYLAVFLTALAIALPGIVDLIAALNNLPPSYPMGTSLILIGASFGFGVYLLGTSYSVKRMRDGVRCEEDEFTETLRQLSVLLSSGRPLPNAMAHIGDLNKGETAAIFSKAASNIRLFNVDLRAAFFNEKCGSASNVYSDMIRGSIDTITSMSGRGSKSIASVITRLSEHIRNMRAVDLEMKKVIANVTSSMVIIAVFVGPLVGGVATSLGYLLASTLGGSDLSGLGLGEMMVATLNPEIVKFIIGVYVLETTAILSVFSDDLVYGRDAVIKKYHLGMYLPIAATVFALTVYVVQGVLISMT